MIVSSAWAGKRYAVLGLARSGAATVRALVAGGASVVGWDESGASQQVLWEQLKSDRQEYGTEPGFVVKDWLLATDLTGFEAVVVSPGVPLNRHPVAEKAARYGLPIIGDIELFAQARVELPPHKVVGITGTNGKSTTTALVHHVLRAAGVPTLMGGNIGLPILAQEPLPAGGVYVLELSSYQIDLTHSLDCDVAVLLNITPDHLDRYDGFEDYVASKGRLFEMQETGMAVVTDNDHPTHDILMSLKTRSMGTPRFPVNDLHAFGHARTEGGRTWRPMVIPGEMPAYQSEWPSLQGPHNLQNAAAAIGACGILGLHFGEIREALRTFSGLPHRMERVATVGGVTYVDDSKATNPESAAPALAAYPRVHWIVGGKAKGDDLDACAPHFGHVARAYTIGEAGARFAAILSEAGVPVEEAEVLDIAVASAAKHAVRGEVVLLSPACASFDQFRDYEDRGAAFRRAVEALA